VKFCIDPAEKNNLCLGLCIQPKSAYLSFYEPQQWRWDFGDPASGTWNSSTERHPEHVFSSAGKYEVCLTVKNSLGEHTFCRTLFLGVVGAEDIENEASVLVWPNPVSEGLSIALNTPLNSPVFRLFDTTGRLIQEKQIGYGINEIETAALQNGMYLWELRSDGVPIKAGKVIKADK
jgi:PKD repeat protein